MTSVLLTPGDDREVVRATLHQVYYLAVHDEYYAARDLFLMSQQQGRINSMDIATKILYNRAMTQLGLCAFRAGMMDVTETCLAKIMGSRARELLAQGLLYSRYHEKTREQEQLEEQRMVPHHKRINTSLLDARLPEYIERLRGESMLLRMADRIRVKNVALNL